MRTYTSDDGVARPDPIEFALDGQVYTCRELNALELSEMASMHGLEVDDPRSLAFMAQFFRMLLGDEQYAMFRLRCGEFETRTEVFAKILEGVFADFTARPTSPPSDSSPGRRTTGPDSTAASFSRVMHRWEDRPDRQMALLRARGMD